MQSVRKNHALHSSSVENRCIIKKNKKTLPLQICKRRHVVFGESKDFRWSFCSVLSYFLYIVYIISLSRLNWNKSAHCTHFSSLLLHSCSFLSEFFFPGYKTQMKSSCRLQVRPRQTYLEACCPFSQTARKKVVGKERKKEGGNKSKGLKLNDVFSREINGF